MHRQDWRERVRRWLWPKLDGFLRLFGLHALGVTYENQYSLTFRMGEETVEGLLHSLRFVRNEVAYLKRTEDGRLSEGSWVLTHENAEKLDTNPWDHPQFQDDGPPADNRQLHITLYDVPGHEDYTAVYAHEEIDWRDNPSGHLQEKYFRAHEGVMMFRWLIDQGTALAREEDYTVTRYQDHHAHEHS